MKKEFSKKFKYISTGKKFGNVRSEYDGNVFDSNLELKCYKWLKSKNIKFYTQVKFDLEVAIYIADFVLFHKGNKYIIDCKSKTTLTEAFKLKTKLFYLRYKRRIKCIYSIIDLIIYVKGIIKD